MDTQGKSALHNPRHEQFAQSVASGKSATESYISAGYSKSGAHASTHRLLQHAAVKARVEHLRDAASQLAVTRAAVDREYVLARLKENVERAMQHQPVLDRKGKETGICTYQGQVANRALELIGTELGMFVDRSDVSITNLSENTERLHAARERAAKRNERIGNVD